MNKKNFSEILNIQEKNVTDAMLKYKYVEYPINCCQDTPEENLTMFKNIGLRDYKKLSGEIKKYFSDYQTDYLKKLCDAPLSYTAKSNTWKYSTITDNFMRIYTHCRPKLKMGIVLDTNNSHNPQQFIKSLNGGVSYYKKFVCSYHQMLNILYQSCSIFVKFFVNDTVEEFAKTNNIERGNTTIYIYWIETDDTHESVYQSISTKVIKSPSMEANNDWANLFLNGNSMQLSKIQKLNVKYRYKHCRSIFMTYKNIMYKNFSALERDRLLIFSGTVFFSLGLRPCRDIDFYLHNKPIKHPVLNKVKSIFTDMDKSKALDCATKGFCDWTPTGIKKHWDEWMFKGWPNLFGAKNMDEVVLNPKYHYHYLGVKFIIIEADVARKSMGHRPSHIGDILMLKYYPELEIKVNVQPIPIGKDFYASTGVKSNIKTGDNLAKYLKDIQKSINYKHKKKLSIEEIASLFPNKIKLLDLLKERSVTNDAIINSGGKVISKLKSKKKRTIKIKK